jgi:hypothetical protein
MIEIRVVAQRPLLLLNRLRPVLVEPCTQVSGRGAIRSRVTRIDGAGRARPGVGRPRICGIGICGIGISRTCRSRRITRRGALTRVRARHRVPLRPALVLRRGPALGPGEILRSCLALGFRVLGSSCLPLRLRSGSRVVRLWCGAGCTLALAAGPGRGQTQGHGRHRRGRPAQFSRNVSPDHDLSGPRSAFPKNSITSPRLRRSLRAIPTGREVGRWCPASPGHSPLPSVPAEQRVGSNP